MPTRRVLAAICLLVLLGVLGVLGAREGTSTHEVGPAAVHERVASSRRSPPADAEPVAPPVGPWRTLSCPLTVSVPAAATGPTVWIDNPGGEPLSAGADLTASGLVFSVPFDEGVGQVTLPGHEPAWLIWFTDADGALDCVFRQDPARLPHGTLRFPSIPRQEDVTVYAVRGWTQVMAHADTQWVEVDVPVGTYEVQCCRYSGQFSLCGATTEVEVTADRVVEVAPELPGQTPAGPDFDFRVGDDGLIVTTVRLDSASERAGLAVGDRILAIDGESVEGLSHLDVQVILVGEAGSSLLLEVEDRDGIVTTREVERVVGG